MYDIELERSYPTPLANSPLLPLLLLSLARQKNCPRTTECFDKEYDYIIVGSGSAGSTLAGRLSEMPCARILLLEAGKCPPLLLDVNAYHLSYLSTNVDWQYLTVPQKYTAGGFKNRRITYPRGKMLGGTSAMNGNQAMRGSRRVYDQWAEEGAKGWSYCEVLPYFKKMEDFLDPEYVHNGYHGVGGPVSVDKAHYEGVLTKPLIEVFESLGYNLTDVNGPTNTGAYIPQQSLRDGQRCSSSKAYLVPVDNRRNLDIVINAHVTKIVIENKRATGVLFDKDGTCHHVKAKREVIVSAGAFNTPQILMHSGIGPADELNKFDIPIICDLPVGHNLQDHVQVFVDFEIDEKLGVAPADERLRDPKHVNEFIDHRTGLLTTYEGSALHAYVPLYADPAVDAPDGQFYFMESASQTYDKLVGYTPEVYDQVYRPYENKTFFTCEVKQQLPATRGRVRIQSTNPYDPPVIDHQYLEDPLDFETLLKGCHLCRKIIDSPPMQKLGARPISTLFPGCEHLVEDNDAYYRCVIRLTASTFHHAACSVKMGDPNDPTAVLDPQLRVKGVDGLRVCDASIMPLIPSSNTNVPTIMVAEKAADMIKETIKCD